MNYEEFKETLMEDLKQGIYEQTGKECTISVSNVTKLQNESYEAFTIRPEDSAVGINMDVEGLFKEYQKVGDYDKVFDRAFEGVINSFEKQPNIDIQKIGDYDSMKERLSIQVVATERNAEMLSDIPHKEFEDMSMVCRFVLNFGDHEQGSVLVNNSMLERYGVTQEQLFEDALKYAPTIKPSEIKSMAEMMAEITGMDINEINGSIGGDKVPMYVASTSDRVNGAGILAYPDFLENAAEKLGGDFFVLPSSLHEIILVPDDGETDFHVFENMVREVNETQVDPKEQLTDHAYHYDSKEKVFELAEKYDARKKDLSKDEKTKDSVVKKLDQQKNPVEKVKAAHPTKNKSEVSL